MMIENIIKLPELLKKSEISFSKQEFSKVLQDYSFYHISKNVSLSEEEKRKINQNIKESQIIIFSQNGSLNKETGQRYLILGFEKTLILLDQSTTSISFLHDIFSTNSQMSVCYLSGTKNHLNQFLKIQNHEIESNSIFENEIRNFKNSCRFISNSVLMKAYSIICPCIFGYLIKKSYLQLNKFRIEQFINDIENNHSPETISENEYVELRVVENGSLFMCVLIYHIKRGELYVIKKPNSYNQENKKLIERESENYGKIKHPLFPKFYGRVKDKGYIVIEFIKGQTLQSINKLNLTNEDITKIIFELLMIFKYFQDEEFIYRDLKPNNIMIDANKTIVLIDFDRLIDLKNNQHENEQTLDLNSDAFIAPEICFGQTQKYSYKSDIYSLGKVVEYLIDQHQSVIGQSASKEYLYHILQIDEIFKKCRNYLPENRPSISEIISEFHEKIRNNIMLERTFSTYEKHHFYFEKTIETYKNHEKNQKDQNVQNFLGFIYHKGLYVAQNISKAIHYFTLAANQNHLQAQFNLGAIYYGGQNVARDIEKAIHYFSLAANQNHSQAQCNLGVIYSDGQYIARDINQAIYYYSLAANQDHIQAQSNLGSIYYEGKYVTRDINKAIHYFTLAASQNYTQAQFNLGYIYYHCQDSNQNINKAISYFTLAADKNHPRAQYNIGLIYYEGKYVKRDINKAIHYFSLSANQNHPDAQFNLGLIYYEGKHVTRDISQAIYYYSLSANQNHPEAQYNLGVIYFDGQYVTRDINKAIHYFSLASNQNHSNSQSILGVIYSDGQYITRDINKALHYLSLAADQNYPEAQFNLGLIYSESQYANYDMNKAIYYYSLAADQNYPEALINLSAIYLQGQYVTRDVSKAIHYLSLAADQNNQEAQFNLGVIYYNGQEIPRDISQAIHYLSLAANQDDPEAQTILGIIFNEGKYIKRDIDKAIYYFTLAANQNYIEAQFNLGVVYYEGKYVKHDINKAIHYFSLAANQNYLKAQFNLGVVYYEDKYVKQDINKAIHYFSLAANKNDPQSQFNLGLIYYYNQNSIDDFKKGRYYIMLASKNGNREANFVHGFWLHEGKNIKHNILEAIHYYKEASSFNIEYAKNNLGIIYRHGFGEIIEKRIGSSIEYFNEAIYQKDDYLSMYNLSHLYIYEETIKSDINKTIELLIKSSNRFSHSIVLLCLLLVKQFGNNIDIIKTKIAKLNNDHNDITNRVIQNINDYKLFDKSSFVQLYEIYRTKDFLYDSFFDALESTDLQKTKEINHKYPKSKTISTLFYEGFGYDLY